MQSSALAAVGCHPASSPQGVQERPAKKVSGGDVAESEDDEDANADQSDGKTRGRAWCRRGVSGFR